MSFGGSSYSRGRPPPTAVASRSVTLTLYLADAAANADRRRQSAGSAPTLGSLMDKDHHPPARNVGEKARRRHPVNAAFDQGCWRRRPRGSFAPIARAPSSLRTGISLKWTRRRRRRRPHHRPEQVEQQRAAEAEMRRAGFLGHHPPRDKEHHLASRKCRRESTPQTAAPDSSATTRQGIKNTISPAGNVGERAREKHKRRNTS